jgi:hypothetical protein
MEPVDSSNPESPPSDAEQWTDDQWLEWLKATDAQTATADEDASEPLSSRITHSLGGQMLGQAMLGLAQVIYGQKQEEVVIVAEGNSEPEEDEPFAVSLNPEHPEQSVIVFRRPSSNGSS